jgi:methylmalonyl-CoA mutase
MGPRQEREPEPGRFIIEELTDLVEEAVLKEFEAISERGGVLGAMETGYQRGKIQEESMYYEHQKHDGSVPDRRRQHVPQSARDAAPQKIELARSSDEEKQSQTARLADFHARTRAKRRRRSRS